MKFLSKLLKFKLRDIYLSFIKTSKGRQCLDYKQEVLVKQGREQFKSLLKKGLSVPVMFL